MSHGFITRGLLAAALSLAGCSTYRTEPLNPSVELRNLQTRTPAQPLSSGVLGDAYRPEDGLSEPELVMAALAFNPALRERRYQMSRLGSLDLFGMVRFKPELRVNVDQATVGLAADSDMLYTLLVPALRHAWQDDEVARREQTRSEMLAAEILVVAEVRRAHVAVLAGRERVGWAHGRVEHRHTVLRQMEDDPRSSPLDRALAALAWQRALGDERRDAGGLDVARRDLNRLVGFDPAVDLVLSDSARPLLARRSEPVASEELDAQVLSGRWELKSLEAGYRRAEFTYSQAVMGQYPKLRLAPAVTYDRDEGTSFKLGASVRLPWPDDASARSEDALKERDRARAVYLARLHDLRAQAHAANARLVRAITELEVLESHRALTAAALQEGRQRLAGGELSLSDYLPLVERCEDTARWWIDAAQDYRLARIDLDHATGRLNRTPGAVQAP